MAVTVGRRRKAEATREQIAETAKARESDVQTHVRHRRVATSQKRLGFLEAHTDPILMRGLAEQGREPTNEMERRHRRVVRDGADRRSAVRDVAKRVPGAAQSQEAIPCQHDSRSEAHDISTGVRSKVP